MSTEREYDGLRVQTYRGAGGRWKIQTSRERFTGPTGLKRGDTFQTDADKMAGATGVNEFRQLHEVIA